MIQPIEWKQEGSCIRCTSHSLICEGYPRVQRRGKLMNVARHILTRRHGTLPNEIHSRHICDNRWCINPDHIIAGTTQENTSDRVARNRSARNFGTKNSQSVLTEDQVIEIRKLEGKLSQYKIAKRYGIHQTHVHYIFKRKLWSHL